MMISQYTIEQILDRVDIVELIGQRVKLKKTGRTYSGCCPFHQEKTPSFHVYREKGYYHCFGCQANGNAIKFLMELEHRHFIDVMKDLSQQTGIELPKEEQKSNPKTNYKRQIPVKPAITPSINQGVNQNINPDNRPISENVAMPMPDFNAMADFAQADFDQNSDIDIGQHDSQDLYFQPQEASLYDLLENVTQYYQQQLQNNPIAQQYFQQRQLTSHTIETWRLGYAPADWHHLEQVFPHDIEGLKLLGLIREHEQGRSFNLLRDRVIFPIRDRKGRVVGFGGRALNNEIKPKYINSPESEVFRKNQLLYGLYEGLQQKSKNWLMVEGYMDVIALHQAGLTGAVATLGTASNAEHLTQLFKLNPKLTLAFDGDQAGQNAAWRTLELALPLLNDGRELRFFILPEQHDPDSLIQQIGLQQFQQKLNQAPLLSEYLFSQLSKRFDIENPEGKGMLLATLRQLTQSLPQGSYKYLLTQNIRERLGLGFYKGKNKNSITQDQDLQFIGIDRKQAMLVFILSYPILFPQFLDLKNAFAENSLEEQFFHCIEPIYDQLPSDLDQSRLFVWGSCLHLHHQLLPLLKSSVFHDMQFYQPESIEQHAQALILSLKYDYLKQKINHVHSLQESQALLKQLHDIHQQIHSMEIKDE